MYKVLVVFIVVFFFIMRLKKQKGTYVCPSVFFIFIYFISIICCFFDLSITRDSALNEKQFWIPAFLFLLLFFLYFSPFAKIKETSIKEVVLPSRNILDIVSTILIVLSFEAIIFFASGVRNVFSYGDLGAARDDRYIYGQSFVEYGITYTISSVSASLYVFDLLFFFIYAALGNSKKRCLLLFVSSFSEVLHILTEAGRDGVVFWLFSFLFLFLMFKDFIPSKTYKKIRKYFVVVLAVLLVPFVLISVGRFGNQYVNSFISYMGQPFKNFCYFFSISPRPHSCGQSFPLYFEIFHRPMPYYARYGNMYTKSSFFGTFFREFVVNFGVSGTIIIGVLLSLFLVNNVKIRNGRFYFSNFFIYILFFQVYSQGVFYYRHYTRGGNLFIIMCVILFWIFKFIDKNDNRVVLYTQKGSETIST